MGHLLAIPLCGVTACKNLSAKIMKAIKKEHDNRKKEEYTYFARKQADYLTLPDGSDLLQNKKNKASGPLEKAFNVAERNIADKRAARMFYASALSFNLARAKKRHEENPTLPYMHTYTCQPAITRKAEKAQLANPTL
ncbi:LOW QUALITY PROTEIN: hypothetical protein RJ639_016967 [Escallonia herrerae]|uniref:Uncharacterized protein n=1 Tax=Escallonia herrerae TaxID=1293975 RepID=A0AA89AKN1_9ASTE|nr:LOW QUALITY PROTEIN: hypothetical protein RJ639_016967 [Escallonia herrerae]